MHQTLLNQQFEQTKNKSTEKTNLNKGKSIEEGSLDRCIIINYGAKTYHSIFAQGWIICKRALLLR